MLFLVLFWGRMFFITAGYHRYFSHRSLQAQPGHAVRHGRRRRRRAAQKGPLWWAGHHRNHHRYSDTELDLHSPLKGFWWSHVGWILCDKNNAWNPDDIKDFAKYPELRWLNKHDWRRARGRSASSLLPIGGWSGLVFGFFVLDRAAVARHVHGELAGPRDGPAPLRHDRHQPELGAHRLHHPRRGLAQQPPLLPGLGPPRASSGGSSTSATTCSRC